MRFITTYKQGIFLSALTFASYLMGYVRDKVFAHVYGLSTTLDVYHASFIIPDTIMNLFLAGAMVSVLVPFMNKFSKKEEQNILLSSILEFSLVLNILACVIMFFLMPQLVALVVETETMRDAVAFYSRILLLSPLIFLISNFFGGILVNKRNLVFYGLAPIFYNIGIILGAVVIHDQGVLGIIIGALTGALFHLLIRLVGVLKEKEGVQLQWVHFKKKWREIKSSLGYFLQLALPKMISLTTLHINYWLFTYYASRVGTEGSIFALNISRNFYNVPISVISIALATDAFSLLSKQFTDHSRKEFRKTMKRYLLLIGGSGLLFGIIYYFFSPLFVSVLLKGGKFDQAAVQFTGQLLSFFGLVIIFESLMQYFARVLHAMQDTFWQMISQLSCFLVTFVILSSSFESLGIIAIPVSFSMGMLVQNIVQGTVIWFKISHKKDAVTG